MFLLGGNMKKIFITLFLLIFCSTSHGFYLEGIGRLNLPQVNEPATPALSFGDGDTGFYEGADDLLRVAVSGTGMWEFQTNLLIGRSYTKTGAIANNDTSATVPGLTFSNDADTGLGSTESDSLSMIAGGVEGHRITEAAGLIAHVFTGMVKTPTTQTLTGAGAVDIVSAITHVVSTGVNALTFADGAEGQWKTIVMKTDGGAATLTPTSPGNFTTLTFDDVGDLALLIFTNGKWIWMGGTATKTSTYPVLTSCGTSPTLASGSTDYAGTFTIGATGTGCTLTFGTAFSVAPACVTSGAAAITNTQTSTVLTVIAIPGVYNYVCNNL